MCNSDTLFSLTVGEDFIVVGGWNRTVEQNPTAGFNNNGVVRWADEP